MEIRQGHSNAKPEFPILRVLAAFEETLAWPDMTPGTMGRYPLARLSKAFMTATKKRFPSFEAAAERAKTMNA